MHRLPKIVLERLKRKPIANQRNRQSGIENRQFPHPDANLLSAFVEKTLTESERTEVLTHLAQCGECRELVALTLPAKVEVAQLEPLPARRGWSAWPTLRWGVLAAALGAVALVVVLHPYPSRRPETLSKGTRPTLMASASQAARQSPPELPAQPSPKAAVAKAGAESRESPRETAKLEKGAGPPGRQIAAHPVGAETKQRVTLMAAARAPAAAEIENTPTVSRTHEISKSLRPTSVGAMPSAPPPAQPALKLSVAPEGTSKAAVGAELQAGATAVPAATESVAVSTGLKAGLLGGVSAPSSAPSAPLAAVPMRAKSHPAVATGMAFRAEAESAVAQPAPLWTIAPSGKVQRSNDGEKTWEEVHVDDRVTFRVIHAMGREVWAGGSGGALYHSSDGGAIWTRVNLSSGGSPTAETIVLIISALHDPQHVTVMTASGEQWTTEDGGQHWKREPPSR